MLCFQLYADERHGLGGSDLNEARAFASFAPLVSAGFL